MTWSAEKNFPATISVNDLRHHLMTPPSDKSNLLAFCSARNAGQLANMNCRREGFLNDYWNQLGHLDLQAETYEGQQIIQKLFHIGLSGILRALATHTCFFVWN